jgi:4-amino-4-deoxy-L-arabinose transferase-like glycosyltransferase
MKKAAVILLILIAALLRFACLNTVRHNIDHAYPIWQALTTLEWGSFPVVGQSTSVLFANPALTGYLYLPVIALTRSPLAVYVLVVLLNTLAVYFCYRTGRDAFEDEKIALFAAALMAVNPWVIEYSRMTWVQSLMPFFTCAIAWLLFPVLLGKAKRPAPRLIAALVMATVFTQTYLLAFFIIAPITLLLIGFRRNVPVKAALTGAGILIAATGVYACGLLAAGDAVFQRTDDFASTPARMSSEALSHALRLVTGEGYIASRSAALAYADLWQTFEQVVHYGLLVLLIAGIAATVWAIYRKKAHREIGVITFVWWGLPVLAMSYTGNPVHPFYQLLGLPAGYLLAGWGAARLTERSRLQAVLIVAGLVSAGIVLSVSSLRASQQIMAVPGENRIAGLPLETGLRIGAAINQHLPENGVVFSNLERWVLNSFAGRLFPVIDDTRVPLVSIIPKSGGLYLVVTDAEPSLPPFSGTVEQFSLVDGTTITLNRFSPGGADLTEVPVVLDLPAEEGMTFYGYELRQRDERWTLISYWRVDEVRPETSGYAFGLFAHLYNEAGERVQIVDGQVVPGYLWQPGDVHIHRMQFQMGEAFQIRIGQYDAFSGRNLRFKNGTDTVTLEGKEARHQA